MAHFYESSIITTKDGLQCQVYGNEHPFNSILVKPKYIPTDKLESSTLPYRFIYGRKMNRLNLWTEKEGLKKYLKEFKNTYPQYVFNSDVHSADRLFFQVPIDEIERIFFPRKGLSELMSMPEDALDPHLKSAYDFVKILLGSGLRVKDLGITYSTLLGHYSHKVSDINIVVYGKNNFWKLMKYLERVEDSRLRWKTDSEWLDFFKHRNRYAIFDANDFVEIMKKKKSEGFFNESLFVIFAAEKEEETWFKWGKEKYTSLGMAKVKGKVVSNFDSVVRPGCYEIEGKSDGVKKVVFYSRDYCMLASPGEEIEAYGVLEKVEPVSGEPYLRVVVGYFDAYLDDRREQEYIKVIK